MGRHHKPADLSSSSSHSGFNRNPFAIREEKCCIWWLPGWPTYKIPSVIRFLLAVIVCLLIQYKMWCLLQFPEDLDEYPDGFTCAESTHKILDHRNVTISCKPCLECPLGQRPVPPCGSTVQSETSIECRECPPDTYKEGQGTGKCKPCQTCGLRGTISQCTPAKNTLCGECPRGYYQEDYTLDSCKRCSTCCGVKRFAELECIYLKQCVRKNCTQQLKIKESSVLKSEDAMGVAKLFATELTAHERAVTQQSASQSDSLTHARNWVLKDIVNQFKKSQFKREVNVMMKSVNSGRNTSQVVEETSTYTLKGNNSNPATPASVEGNGVASEPTLQSKLQEGFGTTSDASVGEPTLPSTSSNSGNSNMLLAILIVLVAGFLGIAILVVVLILSRTQSGHLPGSGCTITCCPKYISINGDEFRPFISDTSLTDSDCQEIAYINNSGVDNCSEKDADTGDLENLPLTDLPPTLENALIKTLDVLHNGEYGWKRMGKAFGINKVDLKFLESGYKRSMESPTKELLEILDSQRRTVGDLLNKLKGSDVNQPAVAQLICQKWQEVKYAQARK